MTFTFTEIAIIFVIHWIADFIIQTDKEAKGKSKNWNDLLMHTFKYSVCWMPLLYYAKYSHNIEGINILVLFIPITFLAHTITDYFTSRLNSKLWQKGKSHEFFIAVGFDQILHYVQLFLTYYFVTNYAA